MATPRSRRSPRRAEAPRAQYKCSSEHKQHPGSWGAAGWWRRKPELRPCPTDIPSDAIPQQWLDEALARPFCWEPDDSDGNNSLPKYLYWYVRERDAFFVARQTQIGIGHAQSAQYKGFPAREYEIPVMIAAAFLQHNLIDETVATRLRRARKEQGLKR